MPVIFFGLREIGRLGEQGFQVGIVRFDESGESFQAETVAGEGGVEVGGVIAPLDILSRGPRTDFLTCAGEERADEAIRGDGAHAGETGETRSTDEAEENGFGLI